MWMLFRDSTVLAARGAGFLEAVGAGVSGVVVVITMCIFYSDIIANTAVSFLFWYIVGIVAAARMGRYGSAAVIRVQSEQDQKLQQAGRA
jgi:hypothetical protein